MQQLGEGYMLCLYRELCFMLEIYFKIRSAELKSFRLDTLVGTLALRFSISNDQSFYF